jgi:D-alanine-D-alanine ligase
MLEFTLRALKSLRRLQRLPLGVLYYTDEGQDGSQSSETIRKAAAKAKQVLVLRPGNPDNQVITQRRGQRKYLLRVEGKPARLGKASKKPDVLRWVCAKIEILAKLSCQKDRIAVAASNITTMSFPMLLPHRITADLLLSYGDEHLADDTESRMREILGKDGFNWELEMTADRPPMVSRTVNRQLAQKLGEMAAEWEIPFGHESSLWPSVAGLVPSSAAVVCGIGPVAKGLYTPQEAIQRISLLQRTLLLAEFLTREIKR